MQICCDVFAKWKEYGRRRKQRKEVLQSVTKVRSGDTLFNEVTIRQLKYFSQIKRHESLLIMSWWE